MNLQCPQALRDSWRIVLGYNASCVRRHQRGAKSVGTSALQLLRHNGAVSARSVAPVLVNLIPESNQLWIVKPANDAEVARWLFQVDGSSSACAASRPLGCQELVGDLGRQPVEASGPRPLTGPCPVTGLEERQYQ